MTEKSKESRTKCRNRTDIYHYGQYRVIDIMTNAVVTGDSYNMSLDDVERFIEEWKRGF